MSGLTEQLTKSTIVWKNVAVSVATTIAVWTPAASTRIALSGLDISSFGPNTGTVSVFFSTSTNTRGQAVHVYTLGSSASINPRFPGLESRLDIPLNAVSVNVPVQITAYGSELQ